LRDGDGREKEVHEWVPNFFDCHLHAYHDPSQSLISRYVTFKGLFSWTIQGSCDILYIGTDSEGPLTVDQTTEAIVDCLIYPHSNVIWVGAKPPVDNGPPQRPPTNPMAVFLFCRVQRVTIQKGQLEIAVFRLGSCSEELKEALITGIIQEI
jgi:hypothetical protein